MASSARTNADADTSKATFVWTVTHGSYTCQMPSPTDALAADGASHSYTLTLTTALSTLSLHDALPISSINPAKGDTVTVTVTPNDGSDDGTAKAASVTIVNTAPVASTPSFSPLRPEAHESQSASDDLPVAGADLGKATIY